MSDKIHPGQSDLVSVGSKSLTIRSSALVKRGLEALASRPGRIVRFPADRSMGILFISDPGKEDLLERDDYGDFGEALGEVVVPYGKRLELSLSAEAAADPSPLASLSAGDLQKIVVPAEHANDAVLAHLRGLKLAEELYLLLGDSPMTDAGLEHIG
jgi:hypothetical protein